MADDTKDDSKKAAPGPDPTPASGASDPGTIAAAAVAKPEPGSVAEARALLVPILAKVQKIGEGITESTDEAAGLRGRIGSAGYVLDCAVKGQ